MQKRDQSSVKLLRCYKMLYFPLASSWYSTKNFPVENISDPQTTPGADTQWEVQAQPLKHLSSNSHQAKSANRMHQCKQFTRPPISSAPNSPLLSGALWHGEDWGRGQAFNLHLLAHRSGHRAGILNTLHKCRIFGEIFSDKSLILWWQSLHYLCIISIP